MAKIENLPPGVVLRRLADTPTDADYEAISEVFTTCHPDHPSTASEFRERDTRRDVKHFQARFLAEQEGQAVGLGATGQSPWRNDPQKFWMSVEVVPSQRQRGIGGALYDALIEVITPRNPTKIRAGVREDWSDAVAFAAHRGFVEEMREWESRLDVTAFDPTPFVARREEADRQGIDIAYLKELQNTTPDWARRLYELEKETSADVPRTDPFIFPDFAAYERMILQSSGFLPDAYAIAVDRSTGEWVGSSGIWKRQADNWLNTGLTAVKQSHRRRGIAFAMKLKVVDYAKSVHCPIIITENATTNRAMLSINEALGFSKQPAWIACAKHISENQDESE